MRHAAPVSAVAFAPDGTLYSVAYDGCLVEHAATAPRIAQLHAKGINCVACDPMGRRIATGGSDGILTLVERADFAHARLEHPGDVEAVAISPDGRLVASGGTDRTARLFSTSDRHARAVLRHGGTVGSVTFDGDTLVTACNDRRLRRYALDGRLLDEATAADAPIKAVVRFAGGLAWSSHDGRVRVSRRGFADAVTVLRLATTPKALCTSEDGRVLWVGGYDQVLYRVELDADGYWCETARLRVERAWFHGLAAHGTSLAIGSFDGRPELVDLDGARLQHVDSARVIVPCVSAMAATSAGLVVGGDSGRVAAASGPGVPLLETASAVTSLASHASGSIIVGTWGGGITRLDDRIPRWTVRVGVGEGTCPVLRVDSSVEVVVAGLYTGGAVGIEAATGRERWRQSEATGAVKCVSVDGELYAMTGRYDPLRVGRTSDGAIVARLPLGTAVSDVVSFAPRGVRRCPRLAVCAGAGEVWIVEFVVERAEIVVIHRGGGHRAAVKAIAWLDEDTLAAGDYAGEVRIHSIGRASSVLATLPGRLGVSALVAHRGTLAYATFDGAIGALTVAQQEAA